MVSDDGRSSANAAGLFLDTKTENNKLFQDYENLFVAAEILSNQYDSYDFESTMKSIQNVGYTSFILLART